MSQINHLASKHKNGYNNRNRSGGRGFNRLSLSNRRKNNENRSHYPAFPSRLNWTSPDMVRKSNLAINQSNFQNYGNNNRKVNFSNYANNPNTVIHTTKNTYTNYQKTPNKQNGPEIIRLPSDDDTHSLH